MSAEENRAAAGKKFRGGLHDALLGAASVGDQGVARRVARNLRKKIQRDADGKRDVNEIRATKRGSEIAVVRVVNHLHRTCFAKRFRTVPSGDANADGVAAKRERKRAADKPGAENGGALN